MVIESSPIIVRVPDSGPSRTVVLKERVSVREASRILGLSTRRVQTMCEQGILVCIQPGGPKGMYQITRESVLARLQAPD